MRRLEKLEQSGNRQQNLIEMKMKVIPMWLFQIHLAGAAGRINTLHCRSQQLTMKWKTPTLPSSRLSVFLG
jgi:hypothetical protein